MGKADMASPRHQQEPPHFLASVPAIEESGETFRTREQIKDLVEQPLLTACEELYDKNVQTLASSANQKDIQRGEAYILIDFDSLSEENQKIARQYAEPKQGDGHWSSGKTVKIIIPISESTTVDDVSRRATEIAKTFVKQRATWIRKIKMKDPQSTLEDLKKAFGIDPKATGYDDPSVWWNYGYAYDPAKKVFFSREFIEKYYYDPKEDVYYESEEQYRKANEEIDGE